MVGAIRQSGIDVIGGIPWGTHFSQFYETPQDLIDILVPYFREGLAAKEFCIWMTSEPLMVEKAKEALMAAVPDLDDYIARGQIEILDYSKWYIRSGKFSPDEVLQGWVDKLTAAQERGFEGLRLTGNAFWLEKVDRDNFTKYEELVNDVIGRYPMLAICTYSLQKCSAVEMLDVIANHQFTLIKRSGVWEIVESAKHKETEQALCQSEAKWSGLYHSMVEGVALHEIVYDEEGTPVDYVITDVNPSYEKITGLTSDKALGRRASALYGARIAPYLDVYARVASSGTPESFETYFDPMKKHFSISVFSPARGKFATVFSDITERKKTEAELERLASFPKINPNPIVEVDFDGCVHFLNPAANKLFPGLKEDGCNHPWLTDWKQMVRIFHNNGTSNHNRDLLMGDRWYHQSMNIVPNTQRIRIYGLDITDRRRAENALQEANEELEATGEELRLQNDKLMRVQSALVESEEKYRTIVETANEGIWLVDSEARTTYVNKKIAEMLGYSPEEMIGKKSSEFMDEDERARLVLMLERRRRGIEECFEFKFIRREGSILWALISASPLQDRNGKFAGSLGMVTDITKRKQMEEKLRKARDDLELRVNERTSELQDAKENLEKINEELQVEISEHEKTEKALIVAKEAAEAAAEAKAAFLANMSHELRTPLNAVLGFSSLLLDDNLTQTQKEYIYSIRNGGQALLSIISDILELSKAEREKITLDYQPFSLKRCIEESMDLVAIQAEQKGLNLVYTVNYGTPDTIISDHGRLRQVLVNLLSNAVKFTDIGDISVSVTSKVVEGNKHKITFAVKDSGIGMPEDEMDRLFKPFTQLEYVISRKRDGAGLGLAICKKYVELMDGEIWAESVEGKGSTFKFTIQAETIPGKQLHLKDKNRVAAYESLSGKRPLSILVADDIPSNQKVLVEMLKGLGYRADAVADGIEVLQALQIRPYDLILMDIRMPQMDGLTATREIRKLWPNKRPRVVAITAFAMEGDKEKFLEAGMDGYIAKPVKVEDLAALLFNISSAKD